MEHLSIFLVDADQFSLNLYRNHITNQGIANVTTFSTGFDCMNNLYAHPDLVLLSSNLGYDLNLELLKRIKSFDSEIDVILLPGPEHRSVLEKIRHITSTTSKYDYALDYITMVTGRMRTVKKFVRQSA
ncbi:response regulator [Mucilaginibacter yixingensis]|nr:response regulator [Mucilaginibacter yixingensis]